MAIHGRGDAPEYQGREKRGIDTTPGHNKRFDEAVAQFGQDLRKPITSTPGDLFGVGQRTANLNWRPREVYVRAADGQLRSSLTGALLQGIGYGDPTLGPAKRLAGDPKQFDRTDPPGTEYEILREGEVTDSGTDLRREADDNYASYLRRIAAEQEARTEADLITRMKHADSETLQERRKELERQDAAAAQAKHAETARPKLDRAKEIVQAYNDLVDRAQTDPDLASVDLIGDGGDDVA
jgi:hypothetical protein